MLCSLLHSCQILIHHATLQYMAKSFCTPCPIPYIICIYLFIYCCYKNLHSSGKAFQSLPFVTRSDIRYAFSNIRATIFFLQVILINCYFNASDLTPGLFLRCTLQTHYRRKSSRTIITVFN